MGGGYNRLSTPRFNFYHPDVIILSTSYIYIQTNKGGGKIFILSEYLQIYLNVYKRLTKGNIDIAEIEKTRHNCVALKVIVQHYRLFEMNPHRKNRFHSDN